MSGREEVDRARVEALASELMLAVRPLLATPPPSRDHVFIALNALAFVAATIIAGADDRAREFFETALRDNIAVVKAHFG